MKATALSSCQNDIVGGQSLLQQELEQTETFSRHFSEDSQHGGASIHIEWCTGFTINNAKTQCIRTYTLELSRDFIKPS